MAKHRVSSNFGPYCIVHVFDFLLFPFCAPKIHCACGQCPHLPHPRYSSVTKYSEVETDWKKEIVAGRKYYPCLRSEKARKITRIIIQDGQQPDRYSAVTEESEGSADTLNILIYFRRVGEKFKIKTLLRHTDSRV